MKSFRVAGLTVLAFLALSPVRLLAENTPGFKLSSPSFEEGGNIPPDHTCHGKNISPALSWVGAPEETHSFVLIVEDPDSPIGNWTHWVLYNIPPGISNLPSGIPAADHLANNEIQGRNDFQTLGYGGPCPPSGVHRYFFRLYALDYAPPMESGLTRTAVLNMMKGHIIGETSLMGRCGWQKQSSSEIAAPARKSTEKTAKEGLDDF